MPFSDKQQSSVFDPAFCDVYPCSLSTPQQPQGSVNLAMRERLGSQANNDVPMESERIFTDLPLNEWPAWEQPLKVNCSAIVRLRLQTNLNNFALNEARKAEPNARLGNKEPYSYARLSSNTKSYYFPVRIGYRGEFISHEKFSKTERLKTSLSSTSIVLSLEK